MKKIITIITLFIAVSSFAQLKVTDGSSGGQTKIGEVGPFGLPYNARIVKVGDKCVFSYKDLTFKTIDRYESFEFNYSDLDALYELLSNVEDKNGTSQTVEFDNGDVIVIKYNKTMGKVYPYIYHNKYDRSIQLPFLNHKQLAKLFGKK